jgi:hypothetical protein
MNARGSVAIDFRTGRRLTLEFILINVLANKSLGGGLFGVAGCVSALLDIESGSDGWGRTTEAESVACQKSLHLQRVTFISGRSAISLFTLALAFHATPATQRRRNYKRELTAHVCHSLTRSSSNHGKQKSRA